MHDNKKYIALLVIVLTLLGCASPYKFKPQKDEYQYFFGIKLPVLSDNKKQFIVTYKIKKAIKNVKDFKWEEYHNNPSLKRKYFIGSIENSFTDYGKKYDIRYRFENDNLIYCSKNFYLNFPFLNGIKEKLFLKSLNHYVYYPNGNIRTYNSVLRSKITDNYLEYGKDYIFSENGEVLFEIDYEKNFNMKLTKVFELAAPFLSKIKDSTATIDVTRKFDQNSGYWVIQNWETSEIEVSDSLGVHQGTNYNLVIIDDKAQKVIAGKKFTPLKHLQKTIDIDVMIKDYNNQYNNNYLADLYKKRRKKLDSLEIALKNKKW